MPNTYTALATQTLSTTASTVTFSSIPGGYTDLIIVGSLLGSSGYYPRISLNSDSGSNYSYTYVSGNGTSASSGKASNVSGSTYITGNAQLNSTAPLIIETHINNYSNTTTYKTLLTRTSQAGSAAEAAISLWRSTAAITTIAINANGSSFAAGSTFNLYGVANADIGALATGGMITSDSTYWYHTFTANGTFTPKQSLTADMVVIAGGGAGGGGGGGGGGAGGLVYLSSQSLTATGYSITVGAGGTNSVYTSPGSNGGNSQFGALTAALGGGGGQSSSNTSGGVNGGCGGGGNGRNAPLTGGTGLQGGNGGAGLRYDPNINEPGGGGGGTGQNGADGASGSAGKGGNGLTTYSSWGVTTGMGQNVSGTYYFAGGGAGGNWAGLVGTPAVGGYGGGASAPSTATVGTNASANTGGGGSAGFGGTVLGGNGGSGFVIVRYPKA